MNADPFRKLVRSEGVRLYRDLPWRRTRDPYGIWLSEVMLQQTQVVRVCDRWPAWLERFPTVGALAQAPVADVLAAWQGMGYNRRALALHRAAMYIMERFDGEFPRDASALCELPGVGPATAQGIRSFAFDLPGVYLETNVRTVILHHFFPDVPAVPDKELVGIVEATCPGPQVLEGRFALPEDERDTPRTWYYAMLDYGAYLKKTIPNPSRRSASYSRQSAFEGSRRQKRAALVRCLLEAGEGGLNAGEARAALDKMEACAGRPAVAPDVAQSILEDLAREGFCQKRSDVDRYFVAH